MRPDHSRLLPFLFAGVVMLAPGLASAHFVLDVPLSWQKQDGLGDPQKMGPCGDPGMKTGKVTDYHEGEMVHLEFREMLPHGGHYRIALGLHGTADIPVDPTVVAKNGTSISAPIQSPPQFPVLADGILVHTAAEIKVGKLWTWDVKLPTGMVCDQCFLQVTQFMTDHGSNTGGNDGYFYHHCAAIRILPAVASDGGATAADAAAIADVGTPSDVAAMSDVPGKPDTAAADARTNANADGGSDPGEGGAGGAPPAKKSSGCSFAGGGSGGGLLLLIALALRLGARRRSHR
jgi:hypothetical protein